MNAIEIKGLSKSFRGMYAVDHLDMTVPRGAIYGFIFVSRAARYLPSGWARHQTRSSIKRRSFNVFFENSRKLNKILTFI
jgi:hypothetical protein